MKRLSPEYLGFRGHNLEPDMPEQVSLQSVTCTVCERKRNVPLGVAVEQEGQYVCQNCREEEKG